MAPRIAITTALAAILLVIGGPILAHLGVVPALAGAALFALSGFLGLGSFVAGVVAALRAKAYFAALVGSLGCLPLVALAAVTADGLRYPAINDITTDTANPPAFLHATTLPELAGKNLTFPEGNGPIIKEAYPHLAPLHLDQAPVAVHQRARALATDKRLGWTITNETPDFGGFEAVAETRLFRWKDDVVLRILPGPDGGSVVDMRSRSREGQSDLGANARRIRRFLESLAE